MKTFKKSILSAAILGLGIASLPMQAQAEISLPFFSNNPQEQAPSLADMLDKVRPAVVAISVEGKAKTSQSRSSNRDNLDGLPEDLEDLFNEFFGGQSSRSPERSAPQRQFRGLGSGAIINAEKGYVITNNHVIKDADKITIKLEDGREFQAKLVGADPQSDVALVQIQSPKNLTEIKFADSDKLRVGDFAVAIGNPFGLGQTVTSGIVSALGRSTGNIDDGYQNYIQTDAAVNRGNSGGPLVNLNGELIGINTAIISPSGGNAGIAFAIPSNMANNLVQQILEFGEVRRGMLGIKGGELNADLAQAFDIEAKKGAFVSEVMPGSAADKAGLKAGDVITAMNGQAISSFAEMRAKIATSGAGKQIELTYLRDGKSNTAKVTLQSDEQTQTTANSLLPALDGAELNNYDEKGVKGVSIGKIKPNSLAEQRGLKNGDVIIGINRQKVENLGQLRKALDSKPSAIALNIIRGDSNFYLLVQ